MRVNQWHASHVFTLTGWHCKFRLNTEKDDMDDFDLEELFEFNETKACSSSLQLADPAPIAIHVGGDDANDVSPFAVKATYTGTVLFPPLQPIYRGNNCDESASLACSVV
jgi:hypothetical protein